MRTKNEPHGLDTHIGMRLRQIRTQKGYSLENLAEWMNVSKQQVSRIEHGKCRISVVQLFQLARGLDVPLSWFIDDFVDEQESTKWLENMVDADRSNWEASSQYDQSQQLLASWRMIDNYNSRRKLVELAAAIARIQPKP